MFARQAKLDCISSRNEFEQPFPSRWACQKVSHRRRIQKSGDPRERRIAPGASTLQRRRKRRARSRNARHLSERRHATTMFAPLRVPLTAPVIESVRSLREIQSSPRGESIPDSNAIRDGEFHFLPEHGSAWSGGGRAHRAHNRCVEECRRATRARPPQMHSATKWPNRIFRDAIPQQAFRGPTILHVVLRYHIRQFYLRRAGRDINPQPQVAPKSQSPRMDAHGELLRAPESPSRRHPPNWARAQEFSSCDSLLSSAHGIAYCTSKFFNRQLHRYP